MSDDDFEEEALRLDAQFDRVDSALIRSLLLDYDLSCRSHMAALRDILESLQVQAVANEGNTPALPPSSECQLEEASSSSRSPAGSVIFSATESSSHRTHLTSDENASLSSAESPPFAIATMEGESDSAKVAALAKAFPTLSESEIAYQLKLVGFDVEKVTEILLNLVSIDETDGTQTRKGVEAFATEVVRGQPKRKGKARQGRNQTQTIANLDSTSAPPLLENRWGFSQAGIELISDCTGIPARDVTSLWHRSGGTFHGTVQSLVKENISAMGSELPEHESDLNCVILLTEVVPGLPTPDAISFARLSSFCLSRASKMLQAYVESLRLASREVAAAEQIVPAYKQLVLDEVEDSSKSNSAAKSTGRTVPSSACGLVATDDLLWNEREARQKVCEVARRAGSNPLYGGAVAYYASQTSKYREARQEILDQALDDHVDGIVQQYESMAARQAAGTCGPIPIDLHGLSVKEALRVLDRVIAAHASSPEAYKGFRSAPSSGRGRPHGTDSQKATLVFIVGKGIHSINNTPRLGPAVGRFLSEHGWRHEAQEGQIFVFGRR